MKKIKIKKTNTIITIIYEFNIYKYIIYNYTKYIIYIHLNVMNINLKFYYFLSS